MAVRVYFKKVLSVLGKQMKSLIINFRIIVVRGFSLEVKDQVHGGHNGV